MAKSSAVNTTIVIAAYVAAIYLAIKLLPGLLKGVSARNTGRPTVISFPNTTGNAYVSPYPNQAYTPINDQTFTPLYDAAKASNPDSAAYLAGLYEATHGRQFNGDPLTPGQQALLIPKYDDSLDNQWIPDAIDPLLNSFAINAGDPAISSANDPDQADSDQPSELPSVGDPGQLADNSDNPDVNGWDS